MTGYLIDYKGAAFMLPVLLSWDICHSLGEPCDAFEICLLFAPDIMRILPDVIRFKAENDGETVFYGVVDEYEAHCGAMGNILTVRGRGLAALLLDNEAEAAEYYYASLQFILDRHVTPFGISQIKKGYIPSTVIFTVASGSSQWKVLEDFVWFGGGIRPRFSKEGVLLLCEEKGAPRQINADTAVSSHLYRESRYGVISRVIVKNKVWGISSTVDNPDFINRGGNSRRVVNVPRYTYYDTMRHTGQYQIDRSMEDSIVYELTLPSQFSAFPGDSIIIDYSPVGAEGEYRVAESRCWADGNDSGTFLKLIKD